MPKILVQGVEESAGTLGDEAMSLPAQNAELYWYFGAEYGTNYRPYLIKATYLSGDDLVFRGIDLEDRDTEIGPTDSTDTFAVDLSNLNYVYRDEPSTLVNLNPGGTKKYALLFLSDAYIETYDLSKRLAAAVGDPKYPQSAEAVFIAKVALKKLTDKYQKAWLGIQTISQQKSISTNEHLRQWLKDFAPDA